MSLPHQCVSPISQAWLQNGWEDSSILLDRCELVRLKQLAELHPMVASGGFDCKSTVSHVAFCTASFPFVSPLPYPSCPSKDWIDWVSGPGSAATAVFRTAMKALRIWPAFDEQPTSCHPGVLVSCSPSAGMLSQNSNRMYAVVGSARWFENAGALYGEG
jgi:hypothetical protein